MADKRGMNQPNVAVSNTIENFTPNLDPPDLAVREFLAFKLGDKKNRCLALTWDLRENRPVSNKFK